MRFLFSIVATLLLTTSLWASHKMFPADGGSVTRENQRAEALGYERFDNTAEMQLAIDDGTLVPIPITVSPRLPVSRRYVRRDAAAFMLELDARFRLQTGHYLIVDSAVRPADVQKKLRRVNRNAAPATGVRASSHERGTTFDLAKKVFNGRDYLRMKRGEYKWLLWQLFYYRERGDILVIEERACIHVFVGRLQNSPEVGRSVLDGRDDTLVLEERQDVEHNRPSQIPLDGSDGPRLLGRAVETSGTQEAEHREVLPRL
jgi:hypothetical protein